MIHKYVKVIFLIPARKTSPRYTLPETNSKFAPEIGWLEYEFSFPFGALNGLFSGAFTRC